MSIKEKIEENKKPVIIVVAGVVIIAILIIVFVPFGGGIKAPAPTTIVISKKAKIVPPAEQKPVETAKVEPQAGGAPAVSVANETAPVKKPSSTEPVAKPVAAETSATVKAKPAEVKTPVAEATAIQDVTTRKKRTQAVKKMPKQWAINTGSFSNKEEAEKFAAKLREGGYDTVYVTEFTKDNVNWHRVRVGFYRTQVEARKMETAISDKFHIDTPWAVRASSKEVARHTK